MKEKWADYEGAEAPELPEETLCRAEAVQRRARDTLKVQHWQPTAGLRETGHHLTIVLECFHLVSLLRILSKLMQENKFLQQNWLLSPASCKAEKEKYNSNCSTTTEMSLCRKPLFLLSAQVLFLMESEQQSSLLTWVIIMLLTSQQILGKTVLKDPDVISVLICI